MDYIENLKKILQIAKFMGCTIIKTHKSFFVLGKEYETMEQAKLAVDDSFKILANTINNKTVNQNQL
jgi:enoyl-[acyl-carrier-protein] reductase (NADH)